MTATGILQAAAVPRTFALFNMTGWLHSGFTVNQPRIGFDIAGASAGDVGRCGCVFAAVMGGHVVAQARASRPWILAYFI